MKAIINTNSIGIFVNNKLETVTDDHPHYEEIRSAVRLGDDDMVDKLLNIKLQFAEDGIIESGGVLFLYGEELDNHLTQRAFNLRDEGFDTNSLLKFIKNLHENPSKRAVDELYLFLEHHALPITEDGCFLAYKAVRNNYLDIYSGTISNYIGESPWMRRNNVDEDKDRHCSSGLHVGAMGYVKQYGGVYNPPTDGYGNRVMIVKVNPKDAVSVPSDSNCQKLRTCQYTVIAEMDDYESVLENALYTSDGETADTIRDPIPIPEPTFAEDDSLYFEGRRDGRLDAESGLEFWEPDTDSPKYNRGYTNGYNRG